MKIRTGNEIKIRTGNEIKIRKRNEMKTRSGNEVNSNIRGPVQIRTFAGNEDHSDRERDEGEDPQMVRSAQGTRFR
jgi:hypothetical protein